MSEVVKEAINKHAKSLADLEWEIEKINLSHDVDPEKHPLHEVVQDRKRLWGSVDVVLAEFDRYLKDKLIVDKEAFFSLCKKLGEQKKREDEQKEQKQKLQQLLKEFPANEKPSNCPEIYCQCFNDFHLRDWFKKFEQELQK